MRIAVIGTGVIGTTLGGRWADAGHDVVYGARSSRTDGPGGATVRTAADAVAGADAVVLAVPGRAADALLAEIGPTLEGAVVVDATNNIGSTPPNARESVAKHAPGASYVRAFNTLGWENFAEPPKDAALFFAADPAGREVAEELITAVGLTPEYVGDGDAAGTVDALLGLWFALVQQNGGNRKLGFAVVR